MKKCHLILFILFTISASAQSKKETEDWLIYNLNKYCRTTFDFNRLKNDRNKDVSWARYNWDNFTYDFSREGVLRVTKNKFRKDEHNIDTLISWNYTDINIRRITRIEKKINLDSNSIFDNRIASLDFDFSDPTYNSKGDLTEQSVVIYNVLKQQNETPKGHYAKGIVAIVSLHQEALRAEILDRIKKAFEHLVNLLTGKIIKDIF